VKGCDDNEVVNSSVGVLSGKVGWFKFENCCTAVVGVDAN
jgi:hypothetical protein